MSPVRCTGRGSRASRFLGFCFPAAPGGASGSEAPAVGEGGSSGQGNGGCATPQVTMAASAVRKVAPGGPAACGTGAARSAGWRSRFDLIEGGDGLSIDALDGEVGAADHYAVLAELRAVDDILIQAKTSGRALPSRPWQTFPTGAR